MAGSDNYMEEETRVPYELYDDEGDIYRIKIFPHVVASYDLNVNLRYTTLQKLKKAGQLPIGRWLPAHTTIIREQDVDSSWAPSSREESLDDDINSPLNKKTKVGKGNKKKPEGAAPTSKRSLASCFDSLEVSSSIQQDADPMFDIYEEYEKEEGPRGLPEPGTPARVSTARVSTASADIDGREVHPQGNSSGNLPVVTAVARETTSGDVTGSKWADRRHVGRLLVEIGKRSEELKSAKRGEKRHATWRHIASAVSLVGMKYTEEDCIAKKKSLDAYFSRVQRRDGFTAPGKKCFFYDGMRAIREGYWTEELTETYSPEERPATQCTSISPDVGDDFVDQVQSIDIEDTDAPTTASQSERRRATQNQTRTENTLEVDTALLEEYAENKDSFQIASSNAGLLELYGVVSDALSRRGIALSPGECKVRYEALRTKFRREYDLSQISGQGACTWVLFDKMLAIENHKNVTLRPCVTLSCGAQSAVTRATSNTDSTVDDGASRNFKARPPTQNRAKRAMVEKLTGSKEGRAPALPTRREEALQLQRRRVETGERFVEEFSELRSDMRERGETMRKMYEVLLQLKSSRKDADSHTDLN